MKTKGAIEEIRESIVKERNTYRRLLDECLFALNNIPNRRIPDGDGGTVCKLASKIEQVFMEKEEPKP